MHQPGDSRYTMLLAENLLRHGDFALERYALPEADYRLEEIDGHRYYAFPPGSSILSIPFVALMDVRGLSAVREDGTYDIKAEFALDSKLACILMSAFSALAYFTARLVLPASWSLAVTSILAFGTQVFSTLSRSMWSDTWGIVLIGMTVFLLLRSVVWSERLNLRVLATLEGMAYIVRPTNAVVIAGTAVYIVTIRRKEIWQFALGVAAWLGLFFAYSWWYYHKLVPSYFAAERLRFATPLVGFFGNLISPSRGLLVCVPAVISVGIVLTCYRRTLRFRRLAALALFVIAGHFVVLAGFTHWWGGHSYGARLTASLVPWVLLLGVLAVDAMLVSNSPREFGAMRSVLVLSAALLCLASIAINAVGPFSLEATKWNLIPDDIDRRPDRIWSWRRPQFLSPFIEPEGPTLVLPDEGVHVGAPGGEKFLGFGWGWGDGDLCWTDGHSATVRFALPVVGPGRIEFELRPYVVAGKLPEQRLFVSMNGQDLDNLLLRVAEVATYAIVVPTGVAQRENIVVLRLPDAASPASVEGTSDRRKLGVAMRALRWRASPPGVP